MLRIAYADAHVTPEANIVLIGPRAAGKTTIGTMLAKTLQRTFIDLDDKVRERFEQASIQEIWAKHGEHAWRAAEVESLRGLASQQSCIIALGGGAPTVHEIAELLRSKVAQGTALIVYLECQPAELQRRLRLQPGDRPSLTGQTVIDEVPQVLAQREPIYRSLANLIVNVEECDPQKIAAQIMKLAE
jgi:shikimate kinase